MAATPGNSINENSTTPGLVNFDGTSAFSTTGLAQFSTLVAASNNTILNVAPSTQTGWVYTSNGSSAYPSFLPIPSQFTPNAVLNIQEDFIVNLSVSANALVGNYAWGMATASSWVFFASTAGHPGIIANVSTTSGSREFALGSTNSNGPAFVLGAGSIVFNWIFNIVNLSTGTNRYILNFGMGDTSATAAQANGVWIGYSDNVNSGDWTFNTASGSTPTNSNSSVAVTTGWHNAQITINAAGTLCTFVMDGVTLGTINSNIPSAIITPICVMQWVAGTIAAATILVDDFYLTNTLTTPR